jgi:DNA-binding Lrp family transcriptional regulator
MIFPKSDARSQIISVLSQEFPLSFRKLSNRLKENSLSLPDPTLYRILRLMASEGILIKENNEYSLNIKWLDNLSKFKDKVVKIYIEGETSQKQKRKLYSLSRQECSCKKGYAEGFCYVCNEPVCSECGEKTRLHYSCSDKCEHKKGSKGVCVNCQEDACAFCSKEVWTHYPENCIKKPETIVLGILEVDHECWFADLSERTEAPIVLDSFIDGMDAGLGTHSGQVIIPNSFKKVAIEQLQKNKQIVEVWPMYTNKQLVLRTRALFNKSVDEFVRMNKSILLNPIEANDTKERNLILSPSLKEIRNLVNGLKEFGNCRIIACEEINTRKVSYPESREISSFVKKVNEEDLNSAVQKIRLMKRFYE